MNALKRFLFLTKLVIITLSSIHCMGDSKVTIYRLDTDCNKKSFDTTLQFTLIFNSNQKMTDSVQKIYSRYKNVNYDSFHYGFNSSNQLIKKVQYQINDSTKISGILQRYLYAYKNDSTEEFYYYGKSLQSYSCFTKVGYDSISFGKYLGGINPGTLRDTFIVDYYYKGNKKNTDSMIYGLWSIPNKSFIKKYQITYFKKSGDSLVENSYIYSNFKPTATKIQVTASNYYVFIYKYWDLSGNIRQYKDSIVYKNGKKSLEFPFDADINTNHFVKRGKYVYNYLNSKLNYIDYFDYQDVSCTRLSRYKYLYDSFYTTSIIIYKPLSFPELAIYPNPVGTDRIVYFANSINSGIVQVYGLDGKLIYSTSIKSSNKVELPLEIPKGLYLIRVQDNTGWSGYSKVMVE